MAKGGDPRAQGVAPNRKRSDPSAEGDASLAEACASMVGGSDSLRLGVAS
jgi:hypothetical protein